MIADKITDLIGAFELVLFGSELLRLCLKPFNMVYGGVQNGSLVRIRVRARQQKLQLFQFFIYALPALLFSCIVTFLALLRRDYLIKDPYACMRV